MANPKKAAVGFIFITVLIDIIGFGIIIPVLPQLLQQLMHVTDRTDISAISKPAIFLTLIYGLMQFIFAPILGSLSDRYGRRPVLLFSLLGFGLDYIFLAFAPTIGWLFLGRMISGITGASITTASAYMADISNEKNLSPKELDISHEMDAKNREAQIYDEPNYDSTYYYTGMQGKS